MEIVSWEIMLGKKEIVRGEGGGVGKNVLFMWKILYVKTNEICERNMCDQI